MSKLRATIGLWSVSSLASTTFPSRAVAAFSMMGPSARHGAHHSAQKSTTTGIVAERSTTSSLKVASVTSMAVIPKAYAVIGLHLGWTTDCM